VLSRALTNEKQFSFRVDYLVFRLVVYSVVNQDPDPDQVRSALFCSRIEIGPGHADPDPAYPDRYHSQANRKVDKQYPFSRKFQYVI
jgi:hypothetical protein